MSIKKCPNCNDENIEITYNPKLRRHTLTCYNCSTYSKITPKQADMKCPECQSKDFDHDELETVCISCGLVLSSVPPSYAGDTKVIFDWGLKI